MKGDKCHSNEEISQSIQLLLHVRQQEQHYCISAAVFQPRINVFLFFSLDFSLQLYVLEIVHPKGVLTKLCVCVSMRVSIHVSLRDLVRSVPI